MRLIDACALQEEYKARHSGKRLLLIDVAPTVDAVPVRRGRWYKPGGMMPPEYAGVYRCSECDRFAMRDWKSHKQVLSDYCPYCGADMREEKHEVT